MIAELSPKPGCPHIQSNPATRQQFWWKGLIPSSLFSKVKSLSILWVFLCEICSVFLYCFSVLFIFCASWRKPTILVALALKDYAPSFSKIVWCSAYLPRLRQRSKPPGNCHSHKIRSSFRLWWPAVSTNSSSINAVLFFSVMVAVPLNFIGFLAKFGIVPFCSPRKLVPHVPVIVYVLTTTGLSISLSGWICGSWSPPPVHGQLSPSLPRLVSPVQWRDGSVTLL